MNEISAKRVIIYYNKHTDTAQAQKRNAFVKQRYRSANLGAKHASRSGRPAIR